MSRSIKTYGLTQVSTLLHRTMFPPWPLYNVDEQFDSPSVYFETSRIPVPDKPICDTIRRSFDSQKLPVFGLTKMSGMMQKRFVHSDIKVPDFSRYRIKEKQEARQSTVRSEADKKTINFGAALGMGVGLALLAKNASTSVLGSMMPSKKAMAEATTEVNLSNIALGETLTTLWRSKPVFVSHRKPEDIALLQETDLSVLRDPENDADRVKNPEWLIVVAICTHLGCIPIPHAGDYGGYFCPCHASHYDASGRVRKGPAPRNLEVPPYNFLNDDTILIG